MPTNKQRRQAAQRHLQRQLERRAELAAGAAATWASSPRSSPSLVVVGAALLITGVFSGDDTSSDAAEQLVGGSHRQRRGGDHERRRHDLLHLHARHSGNPNLKDVGTPPTPRRRRPQGTSDAADEHQPGRPDADPGPDEGPVRGGELRLPGASRSSSTAAPATARSTSRPSASCSAATRPAPAPAARRYKFAQEIPGGTTYPRGTIAMANTGQPGLDRQPVLPLLHRHPAQPGLHAVGTVDEAGLAVLDKVAAAGNNGSFEPRPAAAPRSCRSRSTR